MRAFLWAPGCKHCVLSAEVRNIIEAHALAQEFDGKPCPQPGCGKHIDLVQIMFIEEEFKEHVESFKTEHEKHVLFDRQEVFVPSQKETRTAHEALREFKARYPLKWNVSQKKTNQILNWLKSAGYISPSSDAPPPVLSNLSAFLSTSFEQLVLNVKSDVAKAVTGKAHKYIKALPAGVVNYPTLDALTVEVPGNQLPYLAFDVNLFLFVYELSTIIVGSLDVHFSTDLTPGYTGGSNGDIHVLPDYPKRERNARMLAISLVYLMKQDSIKKIYQRVSLPKAKSYLALKFTDNVERFIVAHEIAHAVLEHQFELKPLDDGVIAYYKRRKESEREADEWASTFVIRETGNGSHISAKDFIHRYQFRLGPCLAFSYLQLLESVLKNPRSTAKRLGIHIESELRYHGEESTHPPTQERWEQMRKHLKNLVPATGLAIIDVVEEMVQDTIKEIT